MIRGVDTLALKRDGRKVSWARSGHFDADQANTEMDTTTVMLILNLDVTSFAQHALLAGLGSQCAMFPPLGRAGRRFTTAHSASISLGSGED